MNDFVVKAFESYKTLTNLRKKFCKSPPRVEFHEHFTKLRQSSFSGTNLKQGFVQIKIII